MLEKVGQDGPWTKFGQLIILSFCDAITSCERFRDPELFALSFVHNSSGDAEAHFLAHKKSQRLKDGCFQAMRAEAL